MRVFAPCVDFIFLTYPCFRDAKIARAKLEVASVSENKETMRVEYSTVSECTAAPQSCLVCAGGRVRVRSDTQSPLSLSFSFSLPLQLALRRPHPCGMAVYCSDGRVPIRDTLH